MGSSGNLWGNSDRALAAVQHLRLRVSNCFHSGWESAGGSTSLGVDVSISASGHVTGVAVEEHPYVAGSIRSCVNRAFGYRLPSLPAPLRAGTVTYVIPLRLR